MHIRDIQIRGVFSNDTQRSEAIAYFDESIRRYERLIARRASTEKPSRTVSEQADDFLMFATFASTSAHDLPFNHPLRAASSFD